jgi:V/A-type H+-transporting ATPase subunit I
MRWREALHPVTMQRVAVLAPRDALRAVLVGVADEGVLALDDLSGDADAAGPRVAAPAAARLQRLPAGAAGTAALSAAAPDLDRCEQDGRVDLIAGEAQLEEKARQAVQHGDVSAMVGWMPADALPRLAGRLGGSGGTVVPLRRPAGVQPPTLLPQAGASREFAPLITTYGTVPYADVNPSIVAGLAYVVMFGIMFADVGHGALLLLAAVAIRLGWSKRLTRLRPVWLFLACGGIASMAFGVLYGEFFGPTQVVPTLWLAPLDDPLQLLGVAIAVGALLLAGAYALGSINRFREGGWRMSVYAPSGLAGTALFFGIGAIAGGWYLGQTWLALLGGAVAVAGLVAAYVGLFAGAGGGGSGAAQAGIELFDMVVRLGSSLVSFARLGAFGLTHAALGVVIWGATVALWERGVIGAVGAVALFLVGNALVFGLEGLVAGIQALRLEYYELFSRIFDGEGRPFRPWHVPLATTEDSC